MIIKMVQIILIILVIVVFITSMFGITYIGYPPVISLIWVTSNILGASFPPTMKIVDAQNAGVLALQIIDIIGNIAVTILLISLFFELLGRIDIRGKMLSTKINRMRGHMLLTPANQIAIEAAKLAKRNGIGYVVLDKDAAKVRSLLDEGILAIRGDPTDSADLIKAGIDKAAAVAVCGNDDVENTAIVIESKKANSNVKVVARIKTLEDIPRMKRAGSDSLIIAESVAGSEIGKFITSRF